MHAHYSKLRPWLWNFEVTKFDNTDCLDTTTLLIFSVCWEVDCHRVVGCGCGLNR